MKSFRYDARWLVGEFSLISLQNVRMQLVMSIKRVSLLHDPALEGRRVARERTALAARTPTHAIESRCPLAAGAMSPGTNRLCFVSMYGCIRIPVTSTELQSWAAHRNDPRVLGLNGSLWRTIFSLANPAFGNNSVDVGCIADVSEILTSNA
jgi:hypothetical protein